MSLIKKIFIVAVLVSLVTFVVQNLGTLTNNLTLKFFEFFKMELQTGIWLLFFFLLGLLSWMTADAWRSMGREKLIRKQRKNLRMLDKRLRKIDPKYKGIDIDSDDSSETVEAEVVTTPLIDSKPTGSQALLNQDSTKNSGTKF